MKVDVLQISFLILFCFKFTYSIEEEHLLATDLINFAKKEYNVHVSTGKSLDSIINNYLNEYFPTERNPVIENKPLPPRPFSSYFSDVLTSDLEDEGNRIEKMKNGGGHNGDNFHEHKAQKEKRKFKRSLPDNTIETVKAHLNDSHALLVLHWAGKGSDVIISLSRDMFQALPLFSSNLFISKDFGRTFVKQELLLGDFSKSQVSWFYLSPIFNTHYIFIDTIKKSLWTTQDGANSFTQNSLSFHPSIVLFHPTEWRTVAVLELTDKNAYNVHISIDFAVTWTASLPGVVAFNWGEEQYHDEQGDTYIHTNAPSAIHKYNYLTHNKTQLFTKPSKLQVSKEFVMVVSEEYVVKPKRAVSTLWVSTDRRNFLKAQLPSQASYSDIFIADATEHQITICATNLTSQATHLFTSDSSGLFFTLSLPNILYFNPHKNTKNWLRFLISKPFADLYKLEGLEGIYIATTLNNPNKTITPGNNDNLATMMTFNKGANWRYIPDPSNNSTSFFEQLICWITNGCNLHLAQMYHSQLSDASIQPIISSPSAPGLVIGSGRIGSIHNSSIDTYISSDGGIYWKKSLPGAYKVVLGDHGGFMVAAKVKDVTKNILYSTDEGHSWHSYDFHDEVVRVYGLFTKPGEETGVFTIFASKVISHSWIIFQLNLTTLFTRECTDTDYTYWVPSDHPKVGCLLGRKMVYEKKKPFASCLNGRNYDRDIKEETCPCKMEDFVCDYGFQRNRSSDLCVPNQYRFHLGLPRDCRHGDYYNRSRGYRRVSEDTCEGGMDGVLAAVVTSCPPPEKDEFILIANMTTIHKYSFLSNKTTQIQLRNLMNVAAVEYDYANDCVFFADNMFDNIQRICLRGEYLEQRVVLTENMDQIESLCYDWTSLQLYWLDVAHKRIECVKLEEGEGGGKKRKVGGETKHEIREGEDLGRGDVGIGGRRVVVMDGLTNPRSMAIVPKSGLLYWTSWDSPLKGTVHRSNMAGAHIEQIFETTNSLNVTTPSGITTDVDDKLYFVDAKSGVIVACDVGTKVECKVLYDNHNFDKYPGQQQYFSTAVFKNSLLWTEAIEGSVLLSNKQQSTRPLTLLNGFRNVLSVVAMHATSQSATSACSSQPCTDANSLCFETSTTSFICHCAQGFVQDNKESGKETNEREVDGVMDGTKGVPNEVVKCVCPLGSRLDGRFCVADDHLKCINAYTCTNKRCIPKSYICDHDDDCGDMSDEKNCSYSCPKSRFECNNGRCIDRDWLCDLANDCMDGSDETKEACDKLQKSTKCKAEEFKCAYGKCIEAIYRCNGDDDCHDGSDETNCTYYSTRKPFSCPKTQFACAVEQRCIVSSWKCDGNKDCSDGSDEQGCADVECTSGHVKCQDGQQCVIFWKWCDGEIDCNDGSDEEKCSFNKTSLAPPTSTPFSGCTSNQFKCQSTNHCLSWSQVCDGINDCADLSDERSCANCLPPDRYRCADGGCIGAGLKCNGRKDCQDGSDENECVGNTTTIAPCRRSTLRCQGDDSHLCIPESWMCDGEKDCASGWDEKECYDIPIVCSKGFFSCLFSKSCIEATMVCNGKYECPDGSDEMHCKDIKPAPPTCQSNEYQCLVGGCVSKMAVCDEKWDCIGGMDEHDCSYEKLDLQAVFTVSNVTSISVTFTLAKVTGEMGLTKVPYVTMLYSIGSSSRNIFKSSVTNVTASSLPLVTKVNNLHSHTFYYLTLTFAYQGQLSKQFTKDFLTSGVSSIPKPPSNLTFTLIHTPHDLSVHLSWQPPLVGAMGLYKLQYKVLVTDLQNIYYEPMSEYTFNTEVDLNGRELLIGHQYAVQVFAFSTGMSESSNRVEFPYTAACLKLQNAQILQLSSLPPSPPPSPPSPPPSPSPSSPSPPSPTKPLSYIVDLNHASNQYSYTTVFTWLLPQPIPVFVYKFRISRLTTKSGGSGSSGGGSGGTGGGSSGVSGGSGSSGSGGGVNNNSSGHLDEAYEEDDSFRRFFGDVNDTVTWTLQRTSAHDVACKVQGKCSVQVLGLNPASTYMVDVWADNEDGVVAAVCGYESVFVQTPVLARSQERFSITAVPLQNAIEISVNNLSNDLLTTDLKSVHIEVRFGQIGFPKTNSKLFKITDPAKDLPLKLGGLSSCEKYCVDVSLVWPYRNQLSGVLCVDTLDAGDKLEAPKRLELWKMGVSKNRTKVDVIMQWKPPCISEPATYTLSVDLLSDAQEAISSHSINMTDAAGLKLIRHVVGGLYRGHSYRVKVRRNNPTSAFSAPVFFDADPYPSPHNLTYEVLVSSSLLFILRWSEPPNELPPSYVYEIHHSSLYRSLGLLAPFKTMATTNTTTYVTINQLNSLQQNSFKVRLVSSGLKVKSNFSNVVTVLLRPDQLHRLSLLQAADKEHSKWSSQNKVLLVALPLLVVIVLLSLVVVHHYRGRHKRSGVDGVNPRYTSGSDRAILALLGEDEDQPLISGSNDDDVLIIA